MKKKVQLQMIPLVLILHRVGGKFKSKPRSLYGDLEAILPLSQLQYNRPQNGVSFSFSRFLLFPCLTADECN